MTAVELWHEASAVTCETLSVNCYVDPYGARWSVYSHESKSFVAYDSLSAESALEQVKQYATGRTK